MNFEEAASWTIEEAKTHLLATLPKDWTLESDRVELLFTCTIRDHLKVVRWDEAHPDQRYVLLSAYGWLSSRNAKTANPMWARRQHGLTPELVRQHATFRSSEAPDPEDVTPDEVHAVYARKSP